MSIRNLNTFRPPRFNIAKKRSSGTNDCLVTPNNAEGE
jgi:hypothetical protein